MFYNIWSRVRLIQQRNTFTGNVHSTKAFDDDLGLGFSFCVINYFCTQPSRTLCTITYWLDVASCDYLGKASCSLLRLAMAVCGWLSVSTCGCLWLALANCGRLWLTVAVRDKLWLSVALCISLWLVVAGCGQKWLALACIIQHVAYLFTKQME